MLCSVVMLGDPTAVRAADKILNIMLKGYCNGLKAKCLSY